MQITFFRGELTDVELAKKEALVLLVRGGSQDALLLFQTVLVMLLFPVIVFGCTVVVCCRCVAANRMHPVRDLGAMPHVRWGVVTGSH